MLTRKIREPWFPRRTFARGRLDVRTRWLLPAGFAVLVLFAATLGCAHSQRQQTPQHTHPPRSTVSSQWQGEPQDMVEATRSDPAVRTASFQSEAEQPAVATTERDVIAASGADEDVEEEIEEHSSDEAMAAGQRQGESLDEIDEGRLEAGVAPTLALPDVVESIHATFPLLHAAYQERVIAAGNQTAAWGAFDTKVKAASENGPLGFYETYRQGAGVTRPLYQGGEVFGGYRLGRGSFQPWYLERQTNDGGEFKAGARIPLLRNRAVDARRAELWRADYDRRRAEPEIRVQLVQFVRDGSIAYWAWVAAGLQYDIGERALALARQRNAQLERRVETGDVDPPVLQDNLRSIAKRESKLVDRRRKLQQSAVKLSLFYRTVGGEPIIPTDGQLSMYPQPTEVWAQQLDADITIALSQRPELASLDLLARRIRVDLAEARNDLLPGLDAALVGSQDVGEPTSKKRDKSEFEVEVGVFVDMPVQRRKGRGKIQAACGKLSQIAAKRRFTEDKISVEVRSAHAALLAAFERIDKARESKRLAEYMAAVERRKFELGESNLLSVVLREQDAIEAADSEVEAMFEYFAAQADYDAALARDGRP